MFVKNAKISFVKPCLKIHSNKNHKTFFFESQFFSEYYFKKYLGEGSFGKVFQVQNLLDGNDYALKVLDDISFEDSEIYLNELKIHNGLIHQNIINLKSYRFISENNENRIGILLELADCNLEEKVGELTQELAFKYFKEICEGLKFLHSNDIIHRDIKLGNILIKNNQAKIADFGQAIISSEILQTVSCFGTKLYWPPEIFLGEKYNKTTDIWSLGILFHKMLTKNQHPFDEKEERIKAGLCEIHPSIQNPLFINILEGILG